MKLLNNIIKSFPLKSFLIVLTIIITLSTSALGSYGPYSSCYTAAQTQLQDETIEQWEITSDFYACINTLRGSGSTGACGGSSPGTICNGVCVDTYSDIYNCGVCGNECRGTSSCGKPILYSSTYNNSMYFSLPDCNAGNCVVDFVSNRKIADCNIGAYCKPDKDNSNCAGCSDGYANCNLNPVDECEVYLLGNDIKNCGACGTSCNSVTQYCQYGNCKNYCGNGWIDTSKGEDCDINLATNKTSCNAYNVPGGCAYCDSTCKAQTNKTQKCGDGSINGPEQCDDGTITTNPKYNGQICNAYNIDGGCVSCSVTCQNVTVSKQSCGDNICQRPMETTSNCFKDCFTDGWNTDDDGWNITVDNKLILTMTPVAGVGTGGPDEVLTIYSDYFDIKNDTNYTLSLIAYYKLFPTGNELSGRSLNITIDNTCINSSMIQGDCDIISPELIIRELTSATFKDKTMLIPSNTNTANGYFRNVRLKIVAIRIASSSNPLLLHNISFKEVVTSGVMYTSLPGYGQTALSGCCPIDYCWNGSLCVNSFVAMNNSQTKPIWNNVLDTNWLNKHVNTTSQPKAKGYRCVITNYTSRKADWVVSDIKYNWNYKESGYCARASDCFVNESFGAADVNFGKVNENYSRGCIQDGKVISDTYQLDKGNHYCHDGSWTTKSYIVATQLENISVGQGRDYILQCYDNVSLNHNSPFIVPNANILSSCVIVMKYSLPKNSEQIITGIVLDNTTSADIFLNALIEEYNTNYNGAIAPIADTTACGTPNNGFVTCADHTQRPSTGGGLFIYYNTQYSYFLISDKKIEGLTTLNVWEKIVGFFKGIFSSRATSTNQVYDTINHTTSYDKIYLMRSNLVNVTAIEESKYDELNQTMVNVLYIQYNGSNNLTNPIDRNLLFDRVNDTMRDLHRTNVNVTMQYDNHSNSQEIIVRTQEPSKLWPYMTTILRNRP